MPIFSSEQQVRDYVASVPSAKAMIESDPTWISKIMANPKQYKATIDKMKKQGQADELAKFAAGAPKADSGTGPTAVTAIEGSFPIPQSIKPEEVGIDTSVPEDVSSRIGTSFTETLDKLGGTASQLEDISKQYLSGQIPSDVQAQIRKLTSEKGMAAGLGRGQAGQALTARDVGATSMDLVTQGLQVSQAATSVRQALSEISNRRYEYDKSYALESQKLMEQIRQTDMDAMKIDLARRQFNAEQNLKLVGFVTDLANARAEMQYKLAASDISDKQVVGALDQVLGQIDELVKRSSELSSGESISSGTRIFG